MRTNLRTTQTQTSTNILNVHLQYDCCVALHGTVFCSLRHSTVSDPSAPSRNLCDTLRQAASLAIQMAKSLDAQVAQSLDADGCALVDGCELGTPDGSEAVDGCELRPQVCTATMFAPAI